MGVYPFKLAVTPTCGIFVTFSSLKGYKLKSNLLIDPKLAQNVKKASDDRSMAVLELFSNLALTPAHLLRSSKVFQLRHGIA